MLPASLKIRIALALVFVLLTPCLFAESPPAGDQPSGPASNAEPPVAAETTPINPQVPGPSSAPVTPSSAPVTQAPTEMPPSSDPNDLVSVQFWGGSVFGQGPVQDRSIVPVEMFPFFRMDDSLYFTDLRFFPTIEGTFGGSVGLGYRYYSKSWDRVFGVSGWYDADGTRDDYFQQLGLSLETYSGPFDFRTNFYLPVGQTDRQNSLAVVDNSARFAGNNVVYNELETFTAAMRGLDMEAGIGIPGEFATQHSLRAYAGWYYFVDDQGDHIVGASARIQANLASGLDAAVQVTNDNFYDTRAFVTLSWTFGPLRRSENSQTTAEGRLGEHVTRNYTVLAPTRSRVDADVVAVDPQTGSPYTFAHVDSAAAPGGNGTVNNPFQTIAAAQAANDDIVFVQAGSVFHGANATITMAPGQAILGDGAGIQHTVAIPQLGNLVLPHAAAGSSLPVLDSATGNAVVLASNSVFSGFTITNSTANGLYGNGLSNAFVANVTVDHSGADGIHLLNSAGIVTFSNTSITNSAGDGLAILGGSGNVTFGGQIAGSQGHDLTVSNTSGGTVDLTNAQFTGSGSQGILLQNDAGNINFNNLTVTNSAGKGIDIEGASGTVQFSGTTTVSGAAGPSVYVNNLLSTGSVAFDNLSIDHRHDVGLAINNSSGTVAVSGTTTITNEGGASASALSVTNSSGAVTFSGPVNVVNSTVNPGVNLQNNSGTTTFDALNVSSTNGTALYANNAGTLNIGTSTNGSAGGTIQATNGTAVDIENTTTNVNLTSISSSGAAVGLKLISTPGTFYVFGDSAGTAGSGGTIQGAGTGVLVQNAGTVGLVLMNLNSNGVGVQAQNVASLGLGNVQITNSTSYGIDTLDVKQLMVNNSTFSGNGAANIRFQVDQLGAYTLNASGSSFTSSSADNILVQTLAGSEGSTLTFNAQSNTFQNSKSGTDGINLNWNGNLSATVTQNTFVSTAGSDTGAYINGLSTTQLSTVSITNNSFTGNGGSDTGFQVVTAGPSQLTMTGNAVQFGATGGTGFRFSLGPSVSLDLTSNSVVDSAGGATGVLFDSVTGPASVTIDANAVSLAHHGNGIIFTSVTDPTVSNMTYTLNLAGSQNNVIQGADTPFSVPGETTTGGIVVSFPNADGEPQPSRRSSRANRAVGKLGPFEKQATAFDVEQAADLRLIRNRRQKEFVDDVVRQFAEQENTGPIGGRGDLRGADQIGRRLRSQRADGVASALARTNDLQARR
jgi:hypothetical protein